MSPVLPFRKSRANAVMFMAADALCNRVGYGWAVWQLGSTRPVLLAGLMASTLAGMAINFVSARQVLSS